MTLKIYKDKTQKMRAYRYRKNNIQYTIVDGVVLKDSPLQTFKEMANNHIQNNNIQTPTKKSIPIKQTKTIQTHPSTNYDTQQAIHILLLGKAFRGNKQQLTKQIIKQLTKQTNKLTN